MGFFSDLYSGAKDFVASAVSTVSEGFVKAKEIAGRALGWMAEKAESFIGGVKTVWSAVKPHVDKIIVFLEYAATKAPYPWLKAALLLLSKGLIALTKFENSPIAKKLDEAIKWAIKIANRWQKRREQDENQRKAAQETEELSDAELAEAKSHQSTFRSAEREFATEENRHVFELSSAINDYEISRAELKNALKKEPQNFEHYLRLRATQKLLNMTENKFVSAKSIDDLSFDDLFLVKIAADLVKANPELSNDAAMRLDRILKEVYGRALAPFVFEELVASWSLRVKELNNVWEQDRKTLSKEKILFKNLTLAKEIQSDLSSEEQSLLTQLQADLPLQQAKLDSTLNELNDVSRYVGAVEGFLQLLEKDEQQLESEGKEYLIDEGAIVGTLLLKCAEQNIPFASLTEDEQALVNDYANIFKAESEQRIERVLESFA
ncbi:hypothetical protein [Rheinheimera sp. MM224]|uniref:hypothetical protein n=1 Tax=Rheinheimera sp. MM224 TaxID=3019969 RepID=UPI0021F8DAEA|nr:hypothetical protein [Rheinheimera sp. MM224]CAI3798140.1 hypothetical protein JAMGFMIE_01997 [Rheinheimera sp. MM224]